MEEGEGHRDWLGDRVTEDSAGLPWSLTPSDCTFEDVISLAKRDPSDLSLLRACVYWEYAREMPTMRNLEGHARRLGLCASQLSQFQPFRFSQLAGFPARSWNELNGKQRRMVAGYLVNPDVFFSTDLAMAALLIDGMGRRSRGPVAVIAIPKSVWISGAPKRNIGYIERLLRNEFGTCADHQHRHHRGQKLNDYAKALRVLCYNRIRTMEGNSKASAFLEQLRGDNIKVKLRSPSDGREQLTRTAQKLFPFLCRDEIPLHALYRFGSERR